jgi:hypothetical protein
VHFVSRRPRLIDGGGDAADLEQLLTSEEPQLLHEQRKTGDMIGMGVGDEHRRRTVGIAQRGAQTPLRARADPTSTALFPRMLAFEAQEGVGHRLEAFLRNRAAALPADAVAAGVQAPQRRADTRETVPVLLAEHLQGFPVDVLLRKVDLILSCGGLHHGLHRVVLDAQAIHYFLLYSSQISAHSLTKTLGHGSPPFLAN